MEAVHRHNVGMLQGSDELRLGDTWQVAEAGHEIGISQQVRVEDFDNNSTL